MTSDDRYPTRDLFAVGKALIDDVLLSEPDFDARRKLASQLASHCREQAWRDTSDEMPVLIVPPTVPPKPHDQDP